MKIEFDLNVDEVRVMRRLVTRLGGLLKDHRREKLLIFLKRYKNLTDANDFETLATYASFEGIYSKSTARCDVIMLLKKHYKRFQLNSEL